MLTTVIKLVYISPNMFLTDEISEVFPQNGIHADWKKKQWTILAKNNWQSEQEERMAVHYLSGDRKPRYKEGTWGPI